MDIVLPNSIERILLDEATIQQRVQQMADIISTDYAEGKLRVRFKLEN